MNTPRALALYTALTALTPETAEAGTDMELQRQVEKAGANFHEQIWCEADVNGMKPGETRIKEEKVGTDLLVYDIAFKDDELGRCKLTLGVKAGDHREELWGVKAVHYDPNENRLTIATPQFVMTNGDAPITIETGFTYERYQVFTKDKDRDIGPWKDIALSNAGDLVGLTHGEETYVIPNFKGWSEDCAKGGRLDCTTTKFDWKALKTPKEAMTDDAELKEVEGNVELHGGRSWEFNGKRWKISR